MNRGVRRHRSCLLLLAGAAGERNVSSIILPMMQGAGDLRRACVLQIHESDFTSPGSVENVDAGRNLWLA